MDLAQTRYVRFEGTVVTASPASPDEARLAIKELRQKKRELAHVKRRLLRQQRALAKRTKKATRRRREHRGLAWRIVESLYAPVEKALFHRPSRNPRSIPDAAQIAADLKRADELLLNIDSCIIQLEGKLLERD